MVSDEKPAGQQGAIELPAAHTSPVLPQILDKYNTEEVLFLDVGPTQNTLKGKSLLEIFPADYADFSSMFGNDSTKLATIYFQLGAGYPEGFKVRMPTLKITKNSYQIGLLEYSNYIPTTLQKVHFLQDRNGRIESSAYGRVIDTLYEFLFYLTGG